MMRRSRPALTKFVIVESPNKISSVKKYCSEISDLTFGKSELAKVAQKGEKKEQVHVYATVGHFMEMQEIMVEPLKASKDVSRDSHKFKGVWSVQDDRKKNMAELASAAKAGSLSEIVFATDPDREGELIAAHAVKFLRSMLRDKMPPASRCYIHSITQEGVAEAMSKRVVDGFDDNLASAAETRHLLDRIFGFYGSRFVSLFNRELKSVGRVQTPALQLVASRQKVHEEIKNKKATAFDFKGRAALSKGQGPVTLKVTAVDGNEWMPPSREEAQQVAKLVKWHELAWIATESVASAKVNKTAPPLPLHLQTLMLAMGKSFSSKDVADATQALFMAGQITYPRTDSTRIEEEPAKKIREFVKSKYGANAVGPGPEARGKKKAQNVEDAHEAIRPTNIEANIDTMEFASSKHRDVYRIIRNTTIAAYMKPFETESLSVAFDAAITDSSSLQLMNKLTSTTSESFTVSGRITGRRTKEKGWHAAGTTSSTTPDDQTSGSEEVFHAIDAVRKSIKPKTSVSALVTTISDVSAYERKQSPPPLFFEGSLIEELKKQGIGRPSTYPSVCSTLISRGYVAQKDSKLTVTERGHAVLKLANENFAKFVDLGFTSKMEGELNAIALNPGTESKKKKKSSKKAEEAVAGAVSMHTVCGTCLSALCEATTEAGAKRGLKQRFMFNGTSLNDILYEMVSFLRRAGLGSR